MTNRLLDASEHLRKGEEIAIEHLCEMQGGLSGWSATVLVDVHGDPSGEREQMVLHGVAKAEDLTLWCRNSRWFKIPIDRIFGVDDIVYSPAVKTLIALAQGLRESDKALRNVLYACLKANLRMDQPVSLSWVQNAWVCESADLRLRRVEPGRHGAPAVLCSANPHPIIPKLKRVRGSSRTHAFYRIDPRDLVVRAEPPGRIKPWVAKAHPILHGVCMQLRGAFRHVEQLLADCAASAGNGTWQVQADVHHAIDGKQEVTRSRVIVIGVESAKDAMVTCISSSELPGRKGRPVMHDNKACFAYPIHALTPSYLDTEFIEFHETRALIEAIAELDRELQNARDDLDFVKDMHFFVPAAISDCEGEDWGLFREADFRFTRVVSAQDHLLECTATLELRKFEESGVVTFVGVVGDRLRYQVFAEEICPRGPAEHG